MNVDTVPVRQKPTDKVNMVVPPADKDGEENKSKRPSSDRIYELASQAYEFHQDTVTGDLFAVDIEERLATPLSSRGDLRKRLSRLAKVETGHVPNGQSMSEAIEVMQGDALDDANAMAIHLRVAETSRGVWLDMADRDNRLIFLHDGVWEVTNRTAFGVPVFRRSPSMRPLIEPAHVDDPVVGLAPLWRLANTPPKSKTLLIGFLVHCIIHEASPFPLLYIRAEQGSGKTSMAQILRQLIDPSTDKGGALPVNEEAFALAALNSHLLMYDNVSTIPPSKRDLLCRASTGGTVRKRQLYTDSDEKTYSFMRPIIITAINLGTASPDLTERMVRVELQRIDQSRRLADKQVEGLWKQHRSTIYGALLSLAANVQQLIASGRFDDIDKPRMADFGLVLAALDSIMGTHSLDQYRAQQTEMAVETVADEPTFLALDLRSSDFAEPWHGTSRMLLLKLHDVFYQGDLQTWKKPPESAPDLTRAIDICAPSLRQRGWVIESRKGTGNDSGTRIWTIQAPEEQLLSPKTAPQIPPTPNLWGSGDAGEGKTRKSS